MAKVKEEILYDNLEDKLVVKKTHDYTPDLARIRELRQICGEEQYGQEKKLMAVVPLDLIAQWLQEAGVSWDDHYGRSEVMKKKLQDANYKALRINKGKY